MRVAVGGTFNVVHKGHELLFETAFSAGDSVEVGLTSDEFAAKIKNVAVSPYFHRKAGLAKYLDRFGKPFEIVMISDQMGTAATSERLDAIVVSPETRAVADEINERRRKNGLTPLKVFCIKEVLAEDSGVISSSRVVKGDIDREGHLLRPLKVAVGSSNDVKVTAVRNIFTQVYGLVEVVVVDPEESRPKQPRDEATIEGAIARAKRALGESGADFGVGIEAGLFFNEAVGRHLDVQYCAVLDSAGRMTLGHGPGFEYPPAVVDAVLGGRSVGETMSRITGIENIGHRSGSIGYLSDGLMDRTSLTELAVLMALIPRIRRQLYERDAQACSSSKTASR
jgi:inosine/xanthosine triphosphatase